MQDLKGGGKRAVTLIGVLILVYLVSWFIFNNFVVVGPEKSIPEIAQCKEDFSIESVYLYKECGEDSVQNTEYIEIIVATDESLPIVTIKVEHRINDKDLRLEWQYSEELIYGIESTYGVGTWFQYESIVKFIEGEFPWSGAWTADYKIPPGAFSPYIKLILSRGFFVKEEKLKKDAQARIAKLIVLEIDRSLNLAELDNSVKQISLYSGPIQFAALVVFFMTIVFIIGGTKDKYWEVAADLVAPLILYVGFFGTLMGMSLGLGILGGADLTDELSKGISLGPIGSQIGLALDTTMFAVVLFLVASMFDAFVKAVFENKG